jgi:pimeloyl-ACP methyl ester carboxylesterase
MTACRFQWLTTLAAIFATVTIGRAQTPGVKSGTITLPETRIYYETVGSGPAVVFIHAFALNLREWDDQVKMLAPKYRVISYDRRGYGKSTGIADPNVELVDLRELLDTLGVRSAVFVGHNGGQMIAARFARAYRERVDGMVLYPHPPIPGFPFPPNEPDPLGDRAAFVREHGLDSLFKFVHTLPQFWIPPNRPDIEKRIWSMLRTYSGRDLFQGRPAPTGQYRLPNFEEMKALTVPTLFVTGDRERPHARMVADSMSRWMPNARAVVIPGGGVYVHLNEPDRFNEALLRFLRSLPLP